MKISYRLPREKTKSSGLGKLINLIKKYPKCFGEVCFFTDLNEQCYESLDSYREYKDIFKGWLDELREAGVPSVGLNVLNTIGQNDDGWYFLPESPYQTVVGHDGKTTRGTICTRAPGFKEYICEKYKIIAEANPDFIWVDDDMRVSWHGCEHSCFCHNCINEFNMRMGTSFDRETLVEAIRNDNEEIRKDRIKLQAEGLVDISSAIGKTVHGVNPEIRFGLMTIDGTEILYGNNSSEEILKALKGDMLRPGGGFWTFSSFYEFQNKMTSVAHQIADVPSAKDIQYESETIPHINCKPLKIHALEMTSALMCGCNGIAVDTVIVNEDGYFDRLVGTIDKYREFWNGFESFVNDKSSGGGAIVRRKDTSAKLRSADWFGNDMMSTVRGTYELFGAGFPFTPYEKAADYYIISGKTVYGLTDEEIRSYLSKSAIIDGVAAKLLVERGFGELIGCKEIKEYTNGINEVYTDHSFNLNKEGYTRGGAQAQFRRGEKIPVLSKLCEDAQILTEVRSVTDSLLGYGTYIYENSLGGRVAVLGYAPWGGYEAEERVHLLRKIIGWLSFDKPSAEIDGAYHILPFLRKSEKGFALMLTNHWLEDSGKFKVRVKTEAKGEYKIFNSQTRETKPIEYVTQNGMTEFEVPSIGGWDFCVIYGE